MIVSQKEFCMYVEDHFVTGNLSMIDTVLQACEEFKVDPELVEPLINRSLKEKMEIEFIDLNYIKPSSSRIV